MVVAKSNRMFKRLGAFVMATAMACCMAVTAGAVDANYSYEVDLTVPNLPAGHNLDFFDVATVENDNGVSIVTIPVVEGEVFGVKGKVVGAEMVGSYPGYAVSFDSDAESVVITCPESVSADDFNVNVKFTIDTEIGHMPATGYVGLSAIK